MKTILVLTDLSKEAGHAAFYALDIAARVGAGIHLYHPFTFKERNPLRFPWKLEEYFDIENDKRAKLKLLTEQLEEGSEGNEFKPPISYTCRENQNDFAQILKQMVKEKDVLMILISSDYVEFINSLLFSERENALVRSSSCPVLFVPPPRARKEMSRSVMAASEDSIA